MGGEFLTAPSETVRRRIVAGGLALAINTGLIALLLFLPRTPLADPAPETVDVVLVTLPPQTPDPEPEPEPEAEPEPAPEPEPVEPETATPVEQTPADPTIPEQPAAPAPLARRDAQGEDEEDETETPRPVTGGGHPQTEFTGEALPFPAGPGSTGYAVRNAFCLSSSDANREAGNCPDGEWNDIDLLQHVSPEKLARVEAMMQMDLQAGIAGMQGADRLPVRDLAGQPTLDNPANRTTGAADQMRDTLPALQPDPAFGN